MLHRHKTYVNLQVVDWEKVKLIKGFVARKNT